MFHEKSIFLGELIAKILVIVNNDLSGAVKTLLEYAYARGESGIGRR